MEDKKKNIEVETDFKDVVQNPLRWFGMIYPYMIIIIVLGGLFFIRNIGTFYVNDVKPLPSNPENQKQKIEMKKGVQLAGVEIKTISDPTNDLINKGEELYQANCASCHGDQGLGDGVAGATLDPPPRDLTSNDGWVNGRKISDMYKTLEEGIEGSGMTAYDYMPIKDRFAIIHYVRTLDDDFPKDNEDDLMALEQTYNLSEGQKASNQIPIELAMEKISNEEQNKINQIHKINAKIAADSSAIANLFVKTTNNRINALTTLYNDRIWINNTDNFELIIESNIPENGFNAGIFKLSDYKTKQLHSYLRGFFNNIPHNREIVKNSER